VEIWLAGADEDILRNLTYSPAQDWLSLSLRVDTLERLLCTHYSIFENDEDGDILIRTLAWSLPEHLHDHIETIQPTNSFLRPRAQSKWGVPSPPNWELENRLPTYEELVEDDVLDRGHLDVPKSGDFLHTPTPLEACNRLAISPYCLRVLYGSLEYSPQAPGENRIGLVNFLDQVNNRSDISLYLDQYRPDAANENAAYMFKTTIIAGGDDQQAPDTPEQLVDRKGLEGALDAETIIGLTHPTPMMAYNVGSKPPFHATAFKAINSNEPYLVWLQYLLAQPQLPQVITISYADDEQTVPPSYAMRVCQMFAQLGARGVSVLVASGDQGVGRKSHCISSDGSGRKRFAPSFPASCPYVTAVGATRYLEPEMVAFDARSDYASGGGFSDVFARPRYQEAAVSSYLEKLGALHDGLYNPKGRGIPDISAMGYHFVVVWNATAHLQDGTSASAPTVASLVSLVSDALISDGRPPLGFLNPWIYSKGFEAFTDIVHGSNLGCNTSGFPALEGWDPATGFGTPVSKKLAPPPRLPWVILIGVLAVVSQAQGACV
jgi:tripeptidyl-peptidase I